MNTPTPKTGATVLTLLEMVLCILRQVLIVMDQTYTAASKERILSKLVKLVSPKLDMWMRAFKKRLAGLNFNFS